MTNAGQPPTAVVTPEMTQGQWGPVLTFDNAGIHTHVLPNGRVLMWGRRDRPDQSLDEQECTPFVWDPTDPTQASDPTVAKTVSTPQPTVDGATVNLFCGGHVFLPDGRLLAVGGHFRDGLGIDQASIYSIDGSAHGAGTWEATARMNHGRWYPTALTLGDGTVLVLSGSFADANGQSVPNRVPQVWANDQWASLSEFDPAQTMELFPRVHLMSDGRVFMSGPLQSTWILDTADGGSWQRTPADHRSAQLEYAPAVVYDIDKIVYIGGGDAPTNTVDIIDLADLAAGWQPTGSMKFARRQHNATLLPDGTVLVTGGTRGQGFNNLATGQPVHTAELWDPATGQWTELTDESVDRCYHATAVLLPDATVLSAGGGEYKPDNVHPNDPKDTHRDGQIFRPPYLFKGAQPEITSAPTAPVHYGDTFAVDCTQVDSITKVTWIRLSSVTHSFNQNQRINVLPFRLDAGTLLVTAPSSPNACPPGHYMLFVLNADGVPSVAQIVQIVQIELTEQSLQSLSAVPVRAAPAAPAPRTATEKHGGPKVIVGLTSNCPYGLGTCWGGAHEALNRLEGVDWVNPVANADDSTAEVFLSHPGLPAVRRWVAQFRAVVDERYAWRGVEMTLHGAVDNRDGSLYLAATPQRPQVRLLPMNSGKKIQFDNTSRTLKPVRSNESDAYARLAAAVDQRPGEHTVTVTGPLDETPPGYELRVRVWHE
jgi:galactose oxidase